MGQILLVFILITCFTVYLTLFRKDYFDKMRSTAMLYALIIIFVVMASVMVKHNIMHVYILPFAMVPIFIRVFMDSRTAFMTHAMMVLICASFLQYPLEFIAVELVAGLVAIFSLRELSSRSQLFWTAVFVTIAATLTNLSLDWIRNNDLTKISYSEYNYIAINDADYLRSVLAQLSIFRAVHDALRIESAQSVGNDTDIVVGQPGYAVAIVLGELAQLLDYDVVVIQVIRLIFLHQTVAFSLHRLVTLIDGEIERRF